MSQQFQPNSSHLSSVNPLDVFTGNWVLARHSINVPGLVVEHQVYLPNELETLFTQHVLGLHLNDGNLQEMTRIGKRFYSGTFPKGSSFLIPADIPSFKSISLFSVVQAVAGHNSTSVCFAATSRAGQVVAQR